MSAKKENTDGQEFQQDEEYPQIVGDQTDESESGGEEDQDSDAGETTEHQTSKITVAGKTFDTQQEADEYFSQLERRANTASPVSPTQVAQAESVVEDDGDFLINGEKASELIFTNPGLVLRESAKRAADAAEKRIMDRQNKQTAEQEFWNDFYTKNKDLENVKDLVQDTVRGNWDRLGKLPTDQAKVELAKIARNKIESVLKARGVTTQRNMSDKSPATLGASKSGSQTRTPNSGKVLNFQEQMKALKRNRA